MFDPESDGVAGPPGDLAVDDTRRLQTKTLPTLLYDDIDVNTIEYDGLRAKFKVGPLVDRSNVHSTAEFESFYYKMVPRGLNVAVHAVAGQSTLNSLHSDYFLGGLDSVRGLPDGAIYGTHAAWVNAELRHL